MLFCCFFINRGNKSCTWETSCKLITADQ